MDSLSCHAIEAYVVEVPSPSGRVPEPWVVSLP